MSKFIQLHLLHAYGPNNLNRDDQGRPKSAVMCGVQRQRISSQCLKSWWRTSEVFRSTVGDAIGIRTREIGGEATAHLVGKGIDAKKAVAAARKITALWKSKENAAKAGDDEEGSRRSSDTLFLFTRTEWDRAMALAEKLAADPKAEITHTDLITGEDTAVDLALWGRMLAAAPEHNGTAACHVAHAITTHAVSIENDYFSARDDRPREGQGSGAAHIAAKQFGGGAVFYTYVCLDLGTLLTNLRGHQRLAELAIEALIRAAATVSPGGMQSTMAAQTMASYALVEIGDQQPRALHPAFAKPVRGGDLLGGSVKALESYRNAVASVYGETWRKALAIDTTGESGLGSTRAKPHSLVDLVSLAKGAASATEVA